VLLFKTGAEQFQPAGQLVIALDHGGYAELASSACRIAPEPKVL
jgi:hypothetical protein